MPIYYAGLWQGDHQPPDYWAVEGQPATHEKLPGFIFFLHEALHAGTGLPCGRWEVSEALTGLRVSSTVDARTPDEALLNFQRRLTGMQDPEAAVLEGIRRHLLRWGPSPWQGQVSLT